MFHKKVGKEKKETKIGAMGRKLKKGFVFYCIMVLILVAGGVTVYAKSGGGDLVLVYKCRQKKLNNLYY